MTSRRGWSRSSCHLLHCVIAERHEFRSAWYVILVALERISPGTMGISPLIKAVLLSELSMAIARSHCHFLFALLRVPTRI